MLTSQRHLFDIPRHICYLNAAYMTPMPRAFGDVAAAATCQRMHPWETDPADFFSTSEQVRLSASLVFNCDANDVAFVPAASYAVATAARNLDMQDGTVILTLDEEFPSNLYGWQRLADEKGCRLIRISGPAQRDWTSALLEKIDELGEQIGLVAIPHVHWSTGAMVNLAEIRQATRRIGSALFLDLTQSLGALPISMREIQPDFAVAAGYKWLFGPYALGYMYVNPKWHNGIPLEENWLLRKGAEDFSALTNYQTEYQQGARRYDMGERSNFHLMPLADAALKLIASWGISNIADTLSTLNQRLADQLQTHGFEVTPAGWRSPHLMATQHPNLNSTDLVKNWKTAGIFASARGQWIRIAPHLWIDEEDEGKFFEQLSSKV